MQIREVTQTMRPIMKNATMRICFKRARLPGNRSLAVDSSPLGMSSLSVAPLPELLVLPLLVLFMPLLCVARLRLIGFFQFPVNVHQCAVAASLAI